MSILFQGWINDRPDIIMGKEYNHSSNSKDYEEIKGETLNKKLELIEDEHKKSFKESINSLREYYKNYLECTNFTNLPKEEIYQKAVYFRSEYLPSNEREAKGGLQRQAER